MDVVIGIVASTLTTWFFAHIYYRRANHDQRVVFDKLSAELRDLILNDDRSSLTVRDLNALIRERTIDPTSEDKYPYQACPKCGSANLKRDKDVIVDGDWSDGMGVLEYYPYDYIKCLDCDWARSDLDDNSHA